MEVKNQVRAFIVENFMFGDEGGLEDNTSFFEEGIIDSMGIMELVDFIEKTFDIKIEDDELIPENLDNLNKIGEFLERKRTHSASLVEQ